MNRPQWTRESVSRFWDYYANDPRNADIYFADALGRGIAAVLTTHANPVRVLDMGCGPGFLAERLLESGLEVQGVDLSPAARAAARQRCAGGPRWLGAVEDSKSLQTGSFDAVVCVETLEHLDDEALGGVLAEVRRLLSPGGVALFTTPNEEDLDASLAYCPFCDSEFHQVQHVRSWSAATLSTTLQAAGFAVERCAATDLTWWQPIRDSQWLGVRRFVTSSIDRARHRRDRWGAGPHLLALARRRDSPD